MDLASYAAGYVEKFAIFTPKFAEWPLVLESHFVATPNSYKFRKFPVRNLAHLDVCALPTLIVDNSEMGLKPSSSYKPTHDPLRTLVLTLYSPIHLLTYLLTYW